MSASSCVLEAPTSSSTFLPPCHTCAHGSGSRGELTWALGRRLMGRDDGMLGLGKTSCKLNKSVL